MPYETWRTVDAPLTDSRILAMEAGDPVHLIIWPTSIPGTMYVIERQRKCYLTVIGQFPTGDGKIHWHFMDHNSAQWEALTVDDGLAHAATLTRKALI
jgi:hypothetical protein